MTHFRSNETIDQNNPHWIGPEAGPDARLQRERRAEITHELLDEIEDLGSLVVWMPEEIGKTNHKPLVEHIKRGAEKTRAKQLSATYAGLKAAKKQVHGLLKSAEKDEAAITGLLKNRDDESAMTRELTKPQSAATDAIREFWLAVAVRKNEKAVEPKLETVVVQEAADALDNLLSSNSQWQKEFVAEAARKNARRRATHFTTELGRIEKGLSSSSPISELGAVATNRRGTLRDPYVQEAVERADRFNR